MGTARDIGAALVRIGVGTACFSHGAQKLFGWFGGGGVDETAKQMRSMGFTPGRRNAEIAGLCEAAGGAMLALGLATGPVGAALTGNMIVASSVHAPNGFFNTGGGYELPATYALLGTGFAIAGPGRFSLDALTGDVLNRPWMRVVALAAAAGSAAAVIVKRDRVLAAREQAEEVPA